MRLLRWLALLPGRKVTVYLINGETVTGRVRGIERRAVLMRVRRTVPSGPCRAGEPCSHNRGIVVRERSSEGVSWCRGWAGPAVDALQVALALR